MFTLDVAKLLAKTLDLREKDILELIEIPPDSALGDYAFPCFTLAKNLKKAPVHIALDIAASIKPQGVVETITANGPYVNFFIQKEAIMQEALKEVSFQKQNKTVIIEYSAPNIAKPFGIGHLRSTIIGAALEKTYAYAGWKTISINHIGDWGTQFGKLIAAYKRYPTVFGDEPIKQLLELYVRFHKEAEENPKLLDLGREEFMKLEKKDPENTTLWKLFVEISMKEFDRVYARMNVRFDHITGESFYVDKMDAVVQELKEKNLLEESDGAHIVSLDDEGIETPAIILKSDGSTIYMTRDVAAILYRKKTYAFDKLLYEVGNEQQLHFAQLFALIKKMGYSWYNTCEHVGHGLYLQDNKKMSTRKGASVFIEEVFNEAVERASSVIKEKNPTLANAKEVAEMVGVGAIMFNDLKNDRNNSINFSWEEILDFEGESGPYVQYTHARLKSIIKKSAQKAKANPSLLVEKEEQMLAKQLISFRSVIEKVIATNKPHLIARHTLDLCQGVNSYYQKHKIIQEHKELEQARLALIEHVAQNIKQSMQLLGIDVPQEM